MIPSLETTSLIDQGRGPDAIVCLHGWCCRTGDFAPQAERLAGRCRVFVPDWQQRLIVRKGDCDFGEICQDIHTCIRQAGIVRPLLCGHSLGGLLATLLAFNDRLPIDGLLLLDSTIPLSDHIRTSWLRAAAEFDEGPFQPACEEFARPFFIDAERGPREESIIRGMSSQPAAVASGLLNAMCARSWDASLGGIDAPIHMIASQHGRRNLGPFHRYVPDATSETISGCGHFLTVFQSDRVCDVLIGMLDS